MLTVGNRVMCLQTDTGVMHTLPSRYPRSLLTLAVSGCKTYIAASGNVAEGSKPATQHSAHDAEGSSEQPGTSSGAQDEEEAADALCDQLQTSLQTAPSRRRRPKAQGGGRGAGQQSADAEGRSPIEIWPVDSMSEYQGSVEAARSDA